jgi:hypothetical protein
MQFVRGSGKAAFAVDRVNHQQGIQGQSHVVNLLI